MQSTSSLGKIVVQLGGIIGLVLVTWIDFSSEEQVNTYVYGGMVGAILGAGAGDFVRWFTRK